MTGTPQPPGAPRRIAALLEIGDIKAGRNELSEQDITDLNEVLRQLDDARKTNARLNHRCQQNESRIATFERAVREWHVSERGTYIPLSSLATIGHAAGVDLDADPRFELHYQRVEQLETDLDDARSTLKDLCGRLRAAERVLEIADDGCTCMAVTAARAKADEDETMDPAISYERPSRETIEFVAAVTSGQLNVHEVRAAIEEDSDVQ